MRESTESWTVFVLRILGWLVVATGGLVAAMGMLKVSWLEMAAGAGLAANAVAFFWMAEMATSLREMVTLQSEASGRLEGKDAAQRWREKERAEQAMGQPKPERQERAGQKNEKERYEL